MSDPGINQRALAQLFCDTDERADVIDFSLEVSVLEIYNELVHDLLSSEPSKNLDVKLKPEGGVHVPHLTSVRVASVDDIYEV